MRKIAVLGGTFNPVHAGHVKIALEFDHLLHFDRVLFIPAAMPPHKQAPDLACAEDRLEMCRIAVRNQPHFQVSDMEMRRGGKSYTVDTVGQLLREHPGTELCLIMGCDMFLTLKTWYRADDFLKKITVCAAARQDRDWPALRSYAAELENQGIRCVLLESPALEVSSTQIRSALEGHADPGAVLDPLVADYIARHGLYRGMK